MSDHISGPTVSESAAAPATPRAAPALEYWNMGALEYWGASAHRPSIPSFHYSIVSLFRRYLDALAFATAFSKACAKLTVCVPQIL
jgi:hypothetical protein